MKYVKPNFNREWNEATRYPEFEEMGKNEWIQLASNDYDIKSFSKIKDVLGNVTLDFDSLEDSKKERFERAFRNGEVEIPMAVKFGEDDYDLIGGNTRLAGLVKNNIDPKIWIIDMTKKDLLEACWDGYKQVGGKMKNGKMVPNCVPTNEASSPAQQAAIAIHMKEKGKKPKNESMEDIDEGENKPTKPELWSRAKSMAKSKFDVYPSAYANGWAAKWYKSHGGGWRKKSTNESEEEVNEDLRRWFKEKWVDVSKKVDGKHPPCGRKDADGKSYPKCRPSKKVSKETPKIASSYDKDEKKAMTQQKRRAEKEDPKMGKGNKPTMTHFDEQTMSDSSGAFVTALDNPIKRKVISKFHNSNLSEDMINEQGIQSSGEYDVPLFGSNPRGGRRDPLQIDGPDSIGKSNAVKNKKFPKFGGPGGIYIKIKEKCKKFPYCNQGDINNIEVLREAIEETSKKYGLPKQEVENIVLNGIKQIFI